jgi:hypothetical protein
MSWQIRARFERTQRNYGCVAIVDLGFVIDNSSASL